VTIEAAVRGELGKAEIVRRVNAMLACLQLPTSEVSVLLTDDIQMRKLNRTYRGKDRPTDVLAFSLREGEFSSLAGELLGDLVVSVPTARRQAADARRDLLDEVTLLLAHGLLHLLGYDHDTPAKDRVMRREARRLVEAAGPGGLNSKKARGPNPVPGGARRGKRR
jgi:probable rRNA maturation factor